jgi:hypothetical protein
MVSNLVFSPENHYEHLPEDGSTVNNDPLASILFGVSRPKKKDLSKNFLSILTLFSSQKAK